MSLLLLPLLLVDVDVEVDDDGNDDDEEAASMALSRASVSLEPGSTVVDGGWGGCVRAMYTIGSRRVEVSGGCECIEWDGSDRQSR